MLERQKVRTFAECTKIVCMNKSITALLLSVLMTMVLSSCLNSDDEETTATDDCAISNMTLGTLYRTLTIRRSDGRDTTYTTTIYGGHYAMLVDQLNHRIYNPDSLPHGTDVTRVLFSSISSDGAIAYRTEWGTDTLYSSGDTLDFTSPRYFMCYSYTGNAKQTYEVHVNVHQVNPEKFSWTNVAESAAMKDASAQKLLVLNGRLYDFCVVGGVACVFTSETSDGVNWTRHDLTGLGSFNPNGVQLFNSKFYLVAPSGLLSSANGAEWSAVETGMVPDRLIASTDVMLFGEKNDTLYRSSDGSTWTVEGLDGDAAHFPADEYSSAWLPMNFNANFEYVLWGGIGSDGHGALWKRTLDRTGDNEDVWSYYPASDEVAYPFPELKSTVVVSYDEKTIAMGCLNDTVSLMYVSQDAGRSWEPSSTAYTHPYALSATSLGCAVDNDHYVWLVCGGTGAVLRGRLNRLGFKSEDLSFE